jgi:outer membrane protein OmpA-like peptidoglycan-associated protein
MKLERHDSEELLRFVMMSRPLTTAALVLGLVVGASGGASADDTDRPPKVIIDRAKVDLPNHKLVVQMSHPAARVVVKVFGDSGAVLAEVERKFDGAAVGTPLEMTWTPSSAEAVVKVEVWGYDTKGYYAGIAIVPWSVTIPHEEVNFATDSDAIRAADVPKLQASLAKISEMAQKHASLGKVTLFVLGHTDTVGTEEHNLTLSRRRARAIASWFKAHGLSASLGIAFEGAGEKMLLVKTPDETAEERNRRVDYILALEPPPLPSSELSWKTP